MGDVFYAMAKSQPAREWFEKFCTQHAIDYNAMMALAKLAKRSRNAVAHDLKESNAYAAVAQYNEHPKKGPILKMMFRDLYEKEWDVMNTSDSR